MAMSFNVSRMKSFRVDNHCRQRGFMDSAALWFFTLLFLSSLEPAVSNR
jgi:hypothetical protein